MSKKSKKPKEIDWADDEHFNKNRAVLYIEHSLECPIFTVKADEFLKYLEAKLPDWQFVLVRNGFGKIQPRPGAFEIEFSQNARTSKHNLWSGLEKGPPRRDKFPVFDTLLPEVHKILRTFYSDAVKRADDEQNDSTAST